MNACAMSRISFTRSGTAALLALLFTAQSFAFDVESAKLSVPRILVFVKENETESGSGFVVHSESDFSIVATNYHVVADRMDSLPVYVLRDVQGAIEVRKGEVIWQDHDRDLALVKVPGLKAAALPLATVPPAQGEDVYSLGYPGVADDRETFKAIVRLLRSGTEGVVQDTDGTALGYLEASVSKAAVRRLVTGHWDHLHSTFPLKIIEHDVNTGHGNSGGPLFNTSGQVVGVNTATANLHQGTSLDTVKKSSQISVLTEMLTQQGISFVKGEPVAGARTASSDIVTTVNNGGGGGSSIFLLIVISGVAVLALYVALRKREAVVESYTHFVRRSGGSSSPRNGHTTPPSPLSPDQETVAPALNKTTSTACILEGENPEDRSHIRLVVGESLLREAKERVIVGRSDKKAHLCIRNGSVSGQHLSLLRYKGQFQIEDRESSNGTRINGRRLVPFAPTPIADGDRLELGDVELRFQILNE